MPYADTTRSRLLIRSKSAFGAAFILGATHFQDLRVTGNTLKAAKTTDEDPEIRSDRSPGRSTQTGRSTSGDISGRLTYGTYDDLLASALGNPVTGWSSNALSVGTAPAIFDIEVGLLDVAQFFPYVDQYVGTMTLELGTNKDVALTFGMMGAQSLTATTTSIDPAPVAKTTTTRMRSTLAGAALALGINGAALAAHPGKVTSLRMQTTNNLRPRPDVFSETSDEMGLGEIGVTITVSGYLKDASLYNASLAHQDVAMSFSVADAAGNKYTFYVDRATIEDHSAPPDAKNKDVLNNYTIKAFGTNCLRVVRAPASV